MKIVVSSFGIDEDVTLAVQVCYDALVQSMDFGSGMLSTEELGAILKLGEAAGFEVPCLACAYPHQHYPASKTCEKNNRPGGHCETCHSIATSSERVERMKGTQYFEREIKTLDRFREQYASAAHWPLCPDAELSGFELIEKVLYGRLP